MQWFKKITNSSACVFLFPAPCLFLPCQVLSQGSAWCAPWKTTSFTYLPTQGMLSSPSVCLVNSKVTKARVWKTLHWFFFSECTVWLLTASFFAGETMSLKAIRLCFYFFNPHRDCRALSVWETRGCPRIPALHFGYHAAVLLTWKYVSYSIFRGRRYLHNHTMKILKSATILHWLSEKYNKHHKFDRENIISTLYYYFYIYYMIKYILSFCQIWQANTDHHFHPSGVWRVPKVQGWVKSVDLRGMSIFSCAVSFLLVWCDSKLWALL